MKNWYIWWVERSVNDGQWYGPLALTDGEIWRAEFDVRRGTSGVWAMYRWVARGGVWEYDPRDSIALYVQAGERRFAYFP